MKLIVGLGNPGKKYSRTRHNVGFMIVDHLQKILSNEKMNSWELNKKFNAETYDTTIRNNKIILIKPMTFMNASGQSVQLIAHYYQIEPKDIIVIHDDKDLKLGDVRVQKDRGHAGHNGIKSIIDHIKSQAFIRVRVGIANDNEKKMADTAKFVLRNFGLFEKKKVQEIIERAAGEIKKMIEI